MSVTIYRITRYTVQVLTKKIGEEAHSFITVRLYDEDNVSRAVTVFEVYGPNAKPAKPTGDFDAQTATAHLNATQYPAYIDILRHEKAVYLKLAWAQQGKAMALQHLSIDTKKDVIGEYFQATH